MCLIVETREWRSRACRSSGFVFFKFLIERGNNFKQIAYDSVIGDFKNRGVLVLVNCDDGAGTLHSHDMLNGSADPESKVQLRRDRLSRTSDLTVHRQPTFIADGP